MSEFIPTPDDVAGALSMLADVIGEGLVGTSLGWAAKPTGIGFIVGLDILHISCARFAITTPFLPMTFSLYTFAAKIVLLYRLSIGR
jgi:hypothetical protein